MAPAASAYQVRSSIRLSISSDNPELFDLSTDKPSSRIEMVSANDQSDLTAVSIGSIATLVACINAILGWFAIAPTLLTCNAAMDSARGVLLFHACMTV